MKTLQDYIYEAIADEEINEGKIWNAIKQWFSNIFKGSSKKYDRYATDFDVNVNAEYNGYINSNFKKVNITIKRIDPKSYTKIIYPKNVEPNKEADRGFWEFLNDNLDTIKEIAYAYVYEDDNTIDTIAIVKVLNDTNGQINNTIQLKKAQVLTSYNKVFPLKRVLQELIKLPQYKSIKGISFNETNNTDLYEKLINDCEFTKETVNTTNYAVYYK